MSKAQLVITALFVEGQTPSEVAARYEVHRGWVYKLKARYEADGEAALEPRSRRPATSPRATPAAAVELVLGLRKTLAESGLDAGADTIAWHLAQQHDLRLSRATINRVLVRAGAVVPSRRSDPGAATCASKLTSPTSAGSPTSPTTAAPAPTAALVPTPRS
jgi:transposase